MVRDLPSCQNSGAVMADEKKITAYYIHSDDSLCGTYRWPVMLIAVTLRFAQGYTPMQFNHLLLIGHTG